MSFDVETLYGRRADERWNRMAVGDILERMTWSDPDKVAIIAAPDAVADPRYARISYRQANQTANQLANALLSWGLDRGDRVAMLCENSGEAYLTKIAIAKAGLVAVPVNTMMADDMVADVLDRVGARTAVVDADLWPAREPIFAAAGIRPMAVIRGREPGPAGVPEFGDVVAASPAGEPDVRIHGDDIWEILLTSGTTSMPKAVMISHTYSYTAAMSHALSYSRSLPVESDLRICSFLPVIYHIGDRAYVLSAFFLVRRQCGAGAQADGGGGRRRGHPREGDHHLGRVAAVPWRPGPGGGRAPGHLRPERRRGHHLRLDHGRPLQGRHQVRR
jgi:acyl-coenzyme A synthetase/AMP-(fatty) acid ligase